MDDGDNSTNKKKKKIEICRGKISWRMERLLITKQKVTNKTNNVNNKQ